MGKIKRAILPNQVMIPYWEQGNPMGVTLILLHGLADSRHAFELLLPCLPPSIHAIAPDQRGHGDAGKPEFGYRTKDFTADLVMFMDALLIERAVILGASSGGFAARSFVLDYPERSLGLVLLGAPAALNDNPAVKESWDTTISKLKDPVDPAFVRNFTTNLVSKAVPHEFLEKMIRESLKAPAHVWIETVAGMLGEQFPGELAKINVPALIIWGEQDSLLQRAGQEELAKTIPGSSLAVVPGSGHMLYWERPELVASHVVNFIKEIVKGQGWQA
jgi:pimeloyl-ACP methyl ester carboxylesterase